MHVFHIKECVALLRFYTGVLQQSPVNKYPHACFSNSYDTVYTIIFLYQVMLLLNIYRGHGCMQLQ